MKQTILLGIFVIMGNSLFSQSIRLGLNFPFRDPELTSIESYMNHIKGCGAQIYRQLTYADLIWKQVEPKDNNWNFTYPDSVFLRYTDLEYVVTLYCMSIAARNNNVGYQVPWRACEGSPLCGWKYELDSVATIDYLTTCINRYSNQAKYWELGNESQNGSYPLGIPNLQFVDFVKHNYRWIKSVNPQVKVLLPATVGTYGFPMQNTYNWFRLMFSNGIGNYFNIFSFHDYNSWWTTPIHIDSIIAIRNYYGLQSKEVWITESSISSLNVSSITPDYSSIDEQAADVWRRSTIAWAKGINTFFWHSSWSSPPASEWEEFGLLDQFGKKKKSYHSYKLLAEKIANFSSAEIVSIGVVDDNNTSTTGGNGAWVMKFVVNGQNKYVMWSRNSQAFQLTPSANTKYIITYVVPTTISPDGEIVTFRKDSVNVNSGNPHIFNLSSLPILVEEIIITSIQSITDQNDIKIIPNPANSYIEIISTVNTSSKIEFFDTLGRPILSIDINPWENKKIDVDWIPRGIYFYQINTEHIQAQRGKIVIE
jgi:hypothetical protein